MIAPLHTKLQNAIKEVGDEHNYSYVFDSSDTAYKSLLYVSTTATDATKQVKAKVGVVE